VGQYSVTIINEFEVLALSLHKVG